MPRNFAYWVIVSGAHATAFRAREAEDLLPTLKQLQRTQPDAALKWFERGRVWASPEAAQDALARLRRAPRRDRAWRPGGEHADPRARFAVSRDEKRARFKKRQIKASREGPAPARRTPKPPRGSK
jgi:hypothetical protein